MKPVKTSQRIALAGIVVLAAVTLGLSVPVFVGGRTNSIVIQNASVQAASPESFTVTTPILIRTSPNLTLSKGTLTVNSERGRQPMSAEAVAAILAGGNARIAIEDATFILDVDGNPASDKSAEAPLAPLLIALSRLGFASLSIKKSVLQLRRGSGDVEALSDVRLEIAHKRDNALAVNGSFELRGRQMKIDATVGLASIRKDVVRLPIKGTVKGAFLEASIADGRLVLGDVLQLSAGQAQVQSVGLRQIAGWLGSPWPGDRGLTGFRAKGELEWQAQTITFQNASFLLDGNEATGTLSLGWGKSRPAIEGTLALKSMDLSRYLGPDKPAGGFMERTMLGWLRSATAPGSLALPLVKHLDADLRISANEVRAGAATLGKSAASIAVKDGQLMADVAEIEIGGDGSVHGQVTVDMRGAVPRHIVRGKIEAFDAAKATSLVLGHPVFGGRSSITFDLAGVGETIDQVAGTLHGKLGLELPDGGTIGADLLQLAAAGARDAEQKGWGASARGQTKVSRLATRFVIQGGVLSAESCKATTDDRTIVLTGDVNLASRSLDAQVSLLSVLKPQGATSEGSSSDAAGETLTMRGPWAEPSIRNTSRPNKAAVPSTPPVPPPAQAGAARQPG